MEGLSFGQLRCPGYDVFSTFPSKPRRIRSARLCPLVLLFSLQLARRAILPHTVDMQTPSLNPSHPSMSVVSLVVLYSKDLPQGVPLNRV